MCIKTDKWTEYKMKFHLFTTFAVFCIFKGIFARIQKPPEDLHVFHGESGLFNCTVDEGDQVTWSEVELDSPVQIYFGNVGTSNIQKTDDAKLLPKYDNFYIDSPEGSTFFNLNITEAQFSEDEGTYECNVFGGGAETADLSVSVLPDGVIISCTPVDCSTLDGSVPQDDVTCNCSATGVFPELLNITWKGAAGSPTTIRNPTSTGLSGTFDLQSEAVVQQIGDVASSISCSVGIYAKDPGSRGQSLTYISPMCSLEEPTIKVCTAATFTCKIENQPYPQDLYFQFFFQNGTEISRGLESETVLNLDEGATVDLYCIACNGFMSHRSEVVTYTCPSGTTTIPSTTTDTPTVTTLIDITSRESTKSDDDATTTPTMTLMTTSPPESDNLGLIIGVVIAAVVVGGGAIGFSVYWFGIRTSSRKRSVTGSNNEVGISTANKEKSDKLLYESTGNNFDPPGGADNNTVTASTNETTNSAAPVYGVVNKSTKKKSDNTDGNGVNSKLQSEPDQVEYAAVNKPKPDPQPAPRSSKPPGNNTEPEKVELQYADIDHSNRGRSNEIRQPADEPTEYATVQSVIV